jgi:hypothetical protein
VLGLWQTFFTGHAQWLHVMSTGALREVHLGGVSNLDREVVEVPELRGRAARERAYIRSLVHCCGGGRDGSTNGGG